MRIQKEATQSLLESENAKLETQMESCLEQEQNMLNLSCADFGLFGEAASALEARLHMRPMIIRTHFLAYDAIKTANKTNRDMLSALPSSITAGVLDTVECETEIERLKSKIRRLEDTRDYLISQATSNAQSWGYALVQNITASYASMNSSNEALIEYWRTVISAAYDYASSSAGLYNNANEYINGALAQASAAVEGCIANNSYGLDAYDNLLRSLTTQRLRCALPYLNAEELAALMAALNDDGTISDTEIYDSSELNEALYTALIKLPSEYVIQSDVDAVAKAYSNMWSLVDTIAIERFIELSYVKVDGYAVSTFCRDIPPGVDGDAYAPPGMDGGEYCWGENYGGYSLFQQASLFGRVSGAVRQQFLTVNPDNPNYQMLLAGADLINVLSLDNTQLWTDEVNAKLGLAESSLGEEGRKAIICDLDFNSHLPETVTVFDEASNGRGVASACKYYTITGDLNTIGDLMNRYKSDSLTAEDFTFFGFLADEIPSLAIGELKGIGAPLSLAFDYAVTSSEAEREAALINALRDNQVSSTSSYSQYPVLGECSYSLSLMLTADSAPSAYTTPITNVYMSDSARQTFDNLVEAYNRATGSTYSVDTFINDIQTNTYRSVVPDSSVEPTQTRDFITWCEADADLVYIGDDDDPDGTQHYKGDTAPGKAKNNYEFISDRDGMYKNFEYRN